MPTKPNMFAVLKKMRVTEPARAEQEAAAPLSPAEMPSAQRPGDVHEPPSSQSVVASGPVGDIPIEVAAISPAEQSTSRGDMAQPALRIDGGPAISEVAQESREETARDPYTRPRRRSRRAQQTASTTSGPHFQKSGVLTEHPEEESARQRSIRGIDDDVYLAARGALFTYNIKNRQKLSVGDLITTLLREWITSQTHSR